MQFNTVDTICSSNIYTHAYIAISYWNSRCPHYQKSLIIHELPYITPIIQLTPILTPLFIFLDGFRPFCKPGSLIQQILYIYFKKKTHTRKMNEIAGYLAQPWSYIYVLTRSSTNRSPNYKLLSIERAVYLLKWNRSGRRNKELSL